MNKPIEGQFYECVGGHKDGQTVEFIGSQREKYKLLLPCLAQPDQAVIASRSVYSVYELQEDGKFHCVEAS